MCWKIFTYRHPQKGILLSRMFVEFLNSIQQEWKMNDFEKYISDYELLKELVCEWYFEKKAISDAEYLNQLFCNCFLDDSIKVCLCEFLTLKDKFMNKIVTSFRIVIDEMERYYSENSDRISKSERNFNFADLSTERELRVDRGAKPEIESWLVSFSLINRYTVMWEDGGNSESAWILLGSDYETEISEKFKPINLVGFGNALGDKNRMKILEELKNSGESTLTDLSNKFGLANAVVLYHLDILKKERIIGQRQEGRRVFYWINYSQVKQAILTLQMKLGGEVNESMEETSND